jgi:hypothetical protein
MDEDKHSCLKLESKPQSQCPSDEGLHLRPRSHWDWHYLVIKVKNYTSDGRRYKCFIPEYYVAVTASSEDIAVVTPF